MGGIGKRVLACGLARRPEVRRAFPDGIFCITLGQKPQLAEQQRWLARELGNEALFADERSGKECLRTLLAGRKALLVLDDVWQREPSFLLQWYTFAVSSTTRGAYGDFLQLLQR
jgi:hypothetical protein